MYGTDKLDNESPVKRAGKAMGKKKRVVDPDSDGEQDDRSAIAGPSSSTPKSESKGDLKTTCALPYGTSRADLSDSSPPAKKARPSAELASIFSPPSKPTAKPKAEIKAEPMAEASSSKSASSSSKLSSKASKPVASSSKTKAKGKETRDSKPVIASIFNKPALAGKAKNGNGKVKAEEEEDEDYENERDSPLKDVEEEGEDEMSDEAEDEQEGEAAVKL